MAIEFLFTSTAPIFFTFLPVFALQRGIPIAALALFFPVYGVIFAGARVVVAPFADRIGTGRLLSFSVLSASAGLGLGLFANELIGITLAGALYALGSAIETPATMALAIDRSEPGRVGAAMATYSLGFQAAQGVGAAAFGLIVHNFGFPAPFVVGLLTQIVLLGVIVRHRRELASSHQPDTLADVQADALVPE
jgi:MFS family permease